jgi:outer membrane protein
MKKSLFMATVVLSVILCLPAFVHAQGTTNRASLTNSNATNALGFTLEDFFTAALDFSPTLRIAEERRNIGSARKRAANGRLLPQLNASASLSDNEQETDIQLQEFDGNRYSVQLTQVLFNWRDFSARTEAYLLENQAEAQYFVELSALLTDVAERYFAVLQAEDALESIRSELNAVTNQLSLIQSYYDRQLAQITDLYEAQARLAAVQSEQIVLQSELALAREALRSATGLTAGQLYRLDDAIVLPPIEESIEYWTNQSRLNSQLIQASQYGRQAAEKRVSGSRGAYMPQVSLILQKQDSDLGFDNAPITRTETNYVGLNFSIPLFAGGSNRAAVSEAISLRSIAEHELLQVQLGVDERTRAIYLLLKSTEAQTVAAQRLVESTLLSSEAMQQGFELGTVTSVDVLNALRNQFQAERDLLRIRYEHVTYLLLLKREAGTLTADDLIEVGAWLVEPEG